METAGRALSRTGGLPVAEGALHSANDEMPTIVLEITL
jgi:hypothetical protein